LQTTGLSTPLIDTLSLVIILITSHLLLGQQKPEQLPINSGFERGALLYVLTGIQHKIHRNYNKNIIKSK
jgi:hypothetical protein